MRQSITGKEVIEFIQKHSTEDMKTMTRGMRETIADAAHDFQDVVESVMTTYPELFIINKMHITLKVEDVTGDLIELELGSEEQKEDRK
jgi:hypothetical protein